MAIFAFVIPFHVSYSYCSVCEPLRSETEIMQSR